MMMTLGRYASEPVLWQIVEENGKTATLLCARGLEVKPYNGSPECVTWESSTLREWLNGEFLNSAFTEEERARLVKTRICAERNEAYSTEFGNDTEDTVWIPGIREAERWFGSDAERACRPTDHAREGGAYTNEAGTGWWWLRTVGCDPYEAANVGSDGSVNADGYNVCIRAGMVRPAVVVQLV